MSHPYNSIRRWRCPLVNQVNRLRSGSGPIRVAPSPSMPVTEMKAEEHRDRQASAMARSRRGCLTLCAHSNRATRVRLRPWNRAAPVRSANAPTRRPSSTLWGAITPRITRPGRRPTPTAAFGYRPGPPERSYPVEPVRGVWDAAAARPAGGDRHRHRHHP